MHLYDLHVHKFPKYKPVGIFSSAGVLEIARRCLSQVNQGVLIQHRSRIMCRWKHNQHVKIWKHLDNEWKSNYSKEEIILKNPQKDQH